MKKRALRKDFFMEIRKGRGRFFSIFFIVALGVAFFSGIRASEPDMRYSGDAFFDRNNLMDIKVMGTLGLTDKDTRAIAEVEGVKSVEPGYSTDVLLDVAGNQKVLHVASILYYMNYYTLEEGRMPKNTRECFADGAFLKENGLKIGDKITLSSGSKEPLTDTLKTDTFEIVGSGSSSCYLSFDRGSSAVGNGEVQGFLGVLPQSFALDVYTECYVEVEGAKELVAFTEPYEQKVDAVLKRIESIGDYQGKVRADDIRNEANEEIADAEKELQEGKEDADRELYDARIKIEDGEKELADGKTELVNGKTELEDARKRVADGKKELAAGKKKLMDGRKELESGKAQLYSSQKETDAARKKIEDGYRQLEAGKAELAAKEAEFQKQYEAGMAEIVQGEAELREQIDAAWAQLNEKKEEYEAGAAKLPGLKETIAKLEAGIADGSIAGAQLDYAKKMIETLQAQVDKITAGAQQLAAAEEQILEEERKGEEKLAEGRKQLEDGKAAIAAGWEQLGASEQELAAGLAEVENGQKQIDAGWEKIRANEAEIVKGEAKIAKSEKEIAKGERGIAEGEKGIKEGETKIAENEQKLTDARKEYEDGKKEAEEKIAEGEAEIRDAKQKVKEIEDAKWYVNDRSAVSEYTGYGDNADRMGALGKVFPILFFVVAALISLTTMTRMVEEQRTLIGTLKALGYSKFSIAGKYLSYAMLATIGGSIFGVLIGEKIFPYVIVTAYKIMYVHVPDVVLPYDWKYALMATGAAIFCTASATLLACYRELAAQPAVLMRPPTPKQGKRVFLERITFIWKRLGFIWKSTIRNLIRYKKRFFMTVFGIGGCMALMIVGFGIQDSISAVGEIQYKQLDLYDGMVILEPDAGEEDRKELLDYMESEKEIAAVSEGYLKRLTLKNGKAKNEAFLYVPLNLEKNKEFLVYRDRMSKEEYELGEDDVILTEKTAKMLEINVGDVIEIETEEGEFEKLTVTRICEHYMDHYIYISPKTYEKIYKKPVEENNIYFKMKELDDERLEKTGEKILDKKAALNVTYTNKIQERLDDILESLDIVIVVLIVSAGLLAFVVLYNLNNINITERKRELATIKVLGFYDNEVSAYVYRENIVLTIIGVFAGIVLGSLLHRFVIVTVEIDSVMFTRIINASSYLFSALLTCGFSLFVNFVMHFKLKKINMVESLKSVE